MHGDAGTIAFVIALFGIGAGALGAFFDNVKLVGAGVVLVGVAVLLGT
jgi:hypothetical protein